MSDEANGSTPGRDSILDPTLLRCLFDEAPDGIAVADATMCYVEVNARFCEIVGHTREQLLGMTLANLVVPEQREDVRAAMQQDRQGQRHQWRIRHGDGRQVHIETNARMLSSGHWVAHVRDVSVRQQVQQTLRRAIEARDEMLQIVSHDLRNPLSTIVLSAQVIAMHAESIAGTTSISNAARRILRVGESMARLIGDLLDLASIEVGQLRLQPGPFLAQQLLREAVDAHQAQAESSKLELVVAATNTPSPIMADHDRMLQALANLVGNAIKFSPSGGRVTIRVDDDGDDVRFSVDDSGPGIPAEEVAHAFDRFWQKDSADRRGRGLGLAITKGIVEAHGGQIWIESESGHGTTVCFTLPKASTPTAPDRQ